MGLEKVIKARGLTEYIFLPGATDNPYPYMKTCTIYVQTSLVEGLGMTVIEAVALQKPVVCTNFKTASSIVTAQDIITSMEAPSIAEGICIYLKYPEKMIRTGCGASQITKDKTVSLATFNSLLP